MPEVTGIAPYNAALCEYLHRSGHSVRMITSFPYYPAWEKLPTERRLLARTDDVDGVAVHRCWHYVPKNVTTLRRVWHEASFVLASFIRQIFLSRPDLLVVVSPPLLLGPAAWLLSKLKRTPFVFHVQDLQPDAAAGLGMVKAGAMLSALRWVESFAYRKARLVSGITPGMIQSFQKKGVPRDKCVYFPNGVRIPDFWRLSERGVWRKAHGFRDDDLLVVYSGNIGRKQGLDALLHAASVVEDARIRFLLCGDGADLDRLKQLARELALANVTFLPLQPEVRYRELLADADLSVIPQRSGSGSCFFPSKLLATLAHNCPVLAITDSDTELARAVEEGRFGKVVSPDSPGGIAEALHAITRNAEELKAMGRAGFKFVKSFELDSVLADYTSLLAELIPGQKNAAGGKPAAREQGQKPTANSF